MLPNLKIECHDDYLVIHPIHQGALSGAENVTAVAISDLLEGCQRKEPLKQYVTPMTGEKLGVADKNPFRKFYLNLISADDRKFAGEILARIHLLQPDYDDSNEFNQQAIIRLISECYLGVIQHVETTLITYKRSTPVKMSSVLSKVEAVAYIEKAVSNGNLLDRFMLASEKEAVTIHRIGD